MKNTKPTYKKLTNQSELMDILESSDRKILKWDLNEILKKYQKLAKEGTYTDCDDSIGVRATHYCKDKYDHKDYHEIILYFKKNGNTINYSELYYTDVKPEVIALQDNYRDMQNAMLY